VQRRLIMMQVRFCCFELELAQRCVRNWFGFEHQIVRLGFPVPSCAVDAVGSKRSNFGFSVLLFCMLGMFL